MSTAKAKEVIIKHHRSAGLLTVLALLLVGGAYFVQKNFLQAATFTFTQSSWAGGATASTATHTTNQTGWTQYSATTTGITAGATVSLASIAKTVTDDGFGAQIGGNITTGANPYAVTYDATQNAVWVVNYNSNTLQKFNAATGAQIGGNIATGAGPYSAAYDPTQNAVWVVNRTTNTLQKFNAATGAQIGTNIATGVNPYAATYDATQNAVWVVNYNSDTLQKFNAATGAQIGGNITVGAVPAAVAYDPTQNAVWVVNRAGGALQKFNAATGAQIGTNITTGLSPYAVTYDQTQNAVWVTNYGSNTLQKFNAATGAQIGTNITTGLGPYGVTYDPTQNVVWVTSLGSNTLQKFNAATGAQIGGSITTGVSPAGVAYDPTQNVVWVGNQGSNTLQKFNAATNFEGGTHSNTMVYAAGSLAGVKLTGTDSSTAWATMAAAPRATPPGGSLVSVGGDFVYGIVGDSNSTSFVRYSISGNSWTTMASMPGGTVWYGGALVYPGSGDFIYAFRGSNTTEFYRYSISGNSWTAMAGTPAGVHAGGSLVYPGTGDFIYGLQGNATSTFYRYSISGNLWATMANVPSAVGEGGSLVYPNSGDFIYATDGGANFYRYSILGNSWTAMANTPAALGWGGGALVYAPDGYIYATRGNGGNSLYRYSITANAWETMMSPPGSTGYGRSSVYPGSGDYLYVLAGGSTTFLRYSVTLGAAWTSLAPVPNNVWTGAALVYPGFGDYLYAARGGGTDFYRYSISGNSWTPRAALPLAGGDTASIIYPGYGDYLYFLRAGGTTNFYRYSISGDSWTTMTNLPSAAWVGSALVSTESGNYVGSADDIYATTGGNTTDFYRYSISGNSWTAMASTTYAVNQGGGLAYPNSGSSIYATTGNGTANFLRYSIPANSWTAMASTSGNVSWGGALTQATPEGLVYLAPGNGGPEITRYATSTNTWSSVPPHPTNPFGNGSYLVYVKPFDHIYAFSSTGNTKFSRYLATSHTASGVFTSAVMDLGALASLTTFTAQSITPAGTSITYDVRAGDTATPDGAWAAWQTGVLSGGSIAALGSHRYVQYRANLATTNRVFSPALESVTIGYNQYTSSATLTSSVYNTTDPGSLIAKISWSGSTTTTETLRFQIRSSSDGNTWSGWCGGVNDATCDGTTYFTDSDNGASFGVNNLLRVGGNDQYFQYRAFLASGGGATPTLSQVAVQYVVNGPPDFNSISASQGTNGKVSISYSVRDTDTATGTINPGFVTPSFEYSTNGGSTWAAIPGVDLVVGDTSNKAVGGVTYTPYTATWTATSTAAGVSIANALVRVTVNDNEAANNTAATTSVAFVLDTTAPVVNATLDSSTGGAAVGSVILSVIDGNQVQYRLCNDPAFPASDTQGNSCAWSVLGGNLSSSTVSWIPTQGVGNIETVYLNVRDAYGNTVARTIVAPSVPGSFSYNDVSNVAVPTYSEFMSWNIFAATTSSAFGSYRVYHRQAIDPGTNKACNVTSYGLLVAITDPATNYYRHVISANDKDCMHYYRVAAVDTDGDISGYTTELFDVPNGQGSLDTVAPTITNIATSSVLSNSATITWTTDELANSQVGYSTDMNYGSSKLVDSYATTHSVVLTGLTQNTTYYFRVRSTDPATVPNTSAWSTTGQYGVLTFRTTGGPQVTTLPKPNTTDTTATITWHTNTSSDSYVTYGTSASLSGGTRTGVSTYATTRDADGFVHTVSISALTPGTTYYYQIESTDTNGTTYDKNAGTGVNHYSFNTTKDTQPPVISATSTPVLSSDAAVIVWQTDELATSQIYYDTIARAGNTAQYRYRTVVEPTLSIFHVATLSSATQKYDNIGNSLIVGGNVLTPETLYYVVVRSVDAAANGANSTEWSFTTPASGNVTIVQLGGTTKRGEEPDTSPPTISNVKVTDITPFGATVSFDTDEDTFVSVQYGTAPSYGSGAADEGVFGRTHSVKLRGLMVGSDYHLRVTATDKRGNLGYSTDQTFKTTFLSENLKDLAKIENIEAFQKEIENTIESILPSLVPPFVTKPVVTDITDTSATVTFKTNIKAFPIVGYTEQSFYDESKENPYSGEVSDTENKGTEHTLKLTGLRPNTKYHYQARAFSLPKVIGKSSDYTFITKAAKIQGSVVERKKDSFTIVWVTPEPTTSIIEYKDVKRGITERKVDERMATSHSVKVDNLPSGTLYEVNLSGQNEAGNTLEAGAPLSVTTSTDVAPPEITAFKVDNAFVPGRTDRVQTIVSWETDEASNSAVYYQEGAGQVGDDTELANKVEALDSFTVKHSIIVPNLKPGVIYRVKVTSSDDSGNLAVFGPRTIITPRQNESITDIIFKNFEDSFKFLRKI